MRRPTDHGLETVKILIPSATKFLYCPGVFLSDIAEVRQGGDTPGCRLCFKQQYEKSTALPHAVYGNACISVIACERTLDFRLQHPCRNFVMLLRLLAKSSLSHKEAMNRGQANFCRSLARNCRLSGYAASRLQIALSATLENLLQPPGIEVSRKKIAIK